MDEQKIQMTRSYVTRWLQSPEFRSIQQMFTAEASLKDKGEIPALAKLIVGEVEKRLTVEAIAARSLYGGA